MRIIWHEVKKIWNLKILAVAAMICVLYFLVMNLTSILQTIHSISSNEIVTEMVSRYGTTITDKEMEEFVREFRVELENRGADSFTLEELNRFHLDLDNAATMIMVWSSPELFAWQRQLYVDVAVSDDVPAFIAARRELLIAEANMHIQNNPIFAAHGIADYDDFLAFTENWPGFTQLEELRTHSLVMRTLYGQDSNFVGEKLSSLGFIEFLYDYYNYRGFNFQHRLIERDDIGRMDLRQLSPRQHQRMMEILDTGEYRGTLPDDLFWHTFGFFRHLAFMLILATLILHSTLLTTDKMRNMLPLQFASKLGRRIVLRQFAATLLSSAMLTTLMLTGFGLFLGFSGVFVYWNHGLMTFMNFWGMSSFAAAYFPLTFGNYLVFLAALAYALGLGTASTAFIISRFSRNLITNVIKAIPVFVVLSRLHNLVLPAWHEGISQHFSTAPLTMWNNLYLMTGFVYMDALIIAVFMAFATVSAGYVAMRENGSKRRDLL